jgi:hypothetical protein
MSTLANVSRTGSSASRDNTIRISALHAVARTPGRREAQDATRFVYALCVAWSEARVTCEGMNLSKSLLLIPAVSILFAAGVGAGACSSSVSISSSTPPSGFVAPDGIVVGTTTCMGSEYVVAGSAWLFCSDGVWDYTTDDPSSSYTLDTTISGGDDAGDDASDDASSDDANDDASSDDASDDASGDDASDDAASDDSGNSDDASTGDDAGDAGS